MLYISLDNNLEHHDQHRVCAYLSIYKKSGQVNGWISKKDSI
jgi:hypothetical protein